MQAELRLVEIRNQFEDQIKRIVPLVLEDETVQLILFLRDGSNLRVTEKWRGETLERYGYYWLTTQNELKIGWDNSPHHQKLENFPHHKHIGKQENRAPSPETTLEDVMRVIISQLPARAESDEKSRE